MKIRTNDDVKRSHNKQEKIKQNIILARRTLWGGELSICWLESIVNTAGVCLNEDRNDVITALWKDACSQGSRQILLIVWEWQWGTEYLCTRDRAYVTDDLSLGGVRLSICNHLSAAINRCLFRRRNQLCINTERNSTTRLPMPRHRSGAFSELIELLCVFLSLCLSVYVCVCVCDVSAVAVQKL